VATNITYKRLTERPISIINSVHAVAYDDPLHPTLPTSVTYNVSAQKKETVTITYSAEGYPTIDGIEYRNYQVNIPQGWLEPLSLVVEGGTPSTPVPLGVELSNDTILEGSQPGTLIGILTTISGVGPFTYSIIGGETDKVILNGASNSNLVIDYLADSTDSPFNILIRTTDSNGATYDQILTINITPQPITNIELSNNSIVEGSPTGTVIGTLSTTGGISPYVYSLSGQDASKLQIVGNEVQLAEPSSLNHPFYVFDIISTDAVDNEYTKGFGAFVIPAPYTSTIQTTFDGVSEYTEVLSDPSFKTQSFSLSFWVDMPAQQDSGGILEVGDEYSFRMFSNGQLFCRLRTATAFKDFRIDPSYRGNRTNIVMTYDEFTDTMIMYANGAIASGTQTANDPFPSGRRLTTKSLKVGTASGFFWDNTIDEVSYWDTALSPSEINAIYNDGDGVNLQAQVFSNRLVSWWKMGENATAPTIQDELGINEMTMINMDQTNFVGV